MYANQLYVGLGRRSKTTFLRVALLRSCCLLRSGRRSPNLTIAIRFLLFKRRVVHFIIHRQLYLKQWRRRRRIVRGDRDLVIDHLFFGARFGLSRLIIVGHHHLLLDGRLFAVNFGRRLVVFSDGFVRNCCYMFFLVVVVVVIGKRDIVFHVQIIVVILNDVVVHIIIDLVD